MNTRPPSDEPKKAILVLGMHRSGTSALGGILARLGVSTPKSLMKPAKDNPRGFWESTEIVSINDRLLAAAGSRWNDWSKIDCQRDDLKEIAAELPGLIGREFPGVSFFFAKDPRMCRLMPIWLDALEQAGVNASAIIAFRSPAEVAFSLQSRNGLGLLDAQMIWLRHVLDAEVATRSIPRSSVSFSNLLEDWRRELGRVADDLGVSWPTSFVTAGADVDSFLSAELRHFDGRSVAVAPKGVLGGWLETCHRAIGRLHGQDEKTAIKELDVARAQFDQASAAFVSVLSEEREMHADKIKNLQVKLASSPALYEAMAGRLESIKSSIEAHAKAVSELQRASTASNGQLAEYGALIGKLQASLNERFAQSASAETEVAHLNERLEQEVAMRQQLASELEEVKAKWARLLDQQNRLSEEALDRKASEMASLRGQLQEAREELREASAARSALAEELEAAIERHNLQVQGLAEGLQEQIRVRERQVGSLHDQIVRMGELLQRESKQRLEQSYELARTNSQHRETLDRLLAAHNRISQLGADLDRAKVDQANEETALENEKIALRSALAKAGRDLAMIRADRAYRVVSRIVRLRGRSRGTGAPLSESAAEVIARSGFFDANWYAKTYPDIATSGLTPLDHFMQVGSGELRNPGPAFSTKRYLEIYPDVKAAGVNPLLHYIEHGLREGRSRR